MTDYRLRDDFMLYQGKDGATYRVGQYAREMAFDNKADVASFYTEKRFISKEFQVGLDTAVALAIEKQHCMIPRLPSIFTSWLPCPMPVEILTLQLSLVRPLGPMSFH